MANSISVDRAAHRVDPQRIETIEVLGPTLQFLTPPEDRDAPCIMRGTIPPGVSVPLHSHADAETFLMISGKVDGLVYSGESFQWVPIKAGDVFHVPGDARHGWRNQGRGPAVMIIVTTSRLGRFLKEVGKPAIPGKPSPPPSPEEIQRFLKTSEKYGHWNATPEENAKVGISVPGL
jgi:quercetin dioxygenase-like cupin family protein